MHYLLMYDVVDDYMDRRAPFRQEHITLARAAVARGELVLGGALAQPADGVVLLFRGSLARGGEAFAKSDPYVRAGIVTRWRVREWTTVVGAALRIRFLRICPDSHGGCEDPPLHWSVL